MRSSSRVRSRSGAQDDLVAVDRHFICTDALARVAFERAVGEPPVPVVPGTTHDTILDDELALAERGTLVRADVADREERVADAKHRDGTRPGPHRHRGAGLNITDLADHVFGHRQLAPGSSLAPVSFRSGPSRMISLLTRSRNASGAIGSMTQPWSWSLALRSGALSTLANLSCSAFTTGAGRPAAPAMPNQPSSPTCG